MRCRGVKQTKNFPFLDPGAFTDHLQLHGQEHWDNLIEPVTTETYGLKFLTCLPKLNLQFFNFKYLKG